jgi:hypothetical protein
MEKKNERNLFIIFVCTNTTCEDGGISPASAHPQAKTASCVILSTPRTLFVMEKTSSVFYF